MDSMEGKGRKPFDLAPGEKFVQCPYNESHKITDLRLLVHLQKCRRNYIRSQEARGLDVEFGFCKFNYVHQVPRVELAFHEKHCEDQFSVLKHMAFHSTNEFTKFKDMKRVQIASCLTTLEENTGEEEVWDMSGPGVKYDPREKLEKEPNLYVPSNVTNSERKEYREAHRQRFLEIVTKKENPKKKQVGPGNDETCFVTRFEDILVGDDETSQDYPSNQLNGVISRELTESGQEGAPIGHAQGKGRTSGTQIMSSNATTHTGSVSDYF